MKESSWKDKIETFVACIILIIIWQIVANIIDNSIYLPTIQCVIKNLEEILKDENFLLNLGSSMYRTIISFIVALMLALILGLVSSFNRFIRNMLKPINALAASIPTMVLVVLALIWFDKDKSPFIVGTFIVFPILYDGVLSAIGGVDKNIIEMAKLYKVERVEIIKNIYFPAIKFQIINLLISTFSLAFKVVIAGEVHGQPKYGIGTVIQYEKMNFNTEAIFAWIVIIAVISFVLDILQRLVRKSVFRWMA